VLSRRTNAPTLQRGRSWSRVQRASARLFRYVPHRPLGQVAPPGSLPVPAADVGSFASTGTIWWAPRPQLLLVHQERSDYGGGQCRLVDAVDRRTAAIEAALVARIAAMVEWAPTDSEPAIVPISACTTDPG
jgi:hypothetical protein